MTSPKHQAVPLWTASLRQTRFTGFL